jgi:DNA-binding CsgD family transcriptional regulator/tetratricopeptide (TPR) repeat protein
MPRARPLAGRRQEVAALREHLAPDSPYRAVVLLGEAGVGKSRLVTEISALDEFLVFLGWCLPHSEGLPFLPVVDLLRGIQRYEPALSAQSLAGSPPYVAVELRRVLPELAEAADDIGAPPHEPWMRTRLFDALAQFFANLVTPKPIVLALEDIHWADTTTLEFLDYLLSPGRGLPDKLLLTYRSAETHRADVEDWLDRLRQRSDVRLMELALLTRSETAEQIEALLGHAVAPELADEIFDRSEGNAFFTDQLVAAAREQSADDRIITALPPGLTSLLLSRARPVHGIAREIMFALAVAAHPLEEHQLVSLCDATELGVGAGLEELGQRQLLRRVDTGHRPELRHALLAEAIADSMLASRRRQLHGRLAQLLIDEGGSSPAWIAEHLATAGRLDDELSWRVRAARQAESVYASTEAFRHWQRLMSIWDSVPTAGDRAGIDLAEAFDRVINTADDAGLEIRGAELAEQAFERLADSVSGADAVRLYCTLGKYRWFTKSPQSGIEAFRRAVEIGAALPPDLQFADACEGLGHIFSWQYEYDEARPYAARAVAAAKAAGLTEVVKYFGYGEAVWLARAGNDELARARIQEARAIDPGPMDPHLTMDCLGEEMRAHLALDDLPRVVEIGLPALRDVQQWDARHSYSAQRLYVMVGESLLELGRVSEAAELLDPITPPERFRSSRIAYIQRANLDMVRGDLVAADQFWRAEPSIRGSWPLVLSEAHNHAALRAELALWMGNSALALDDVLTMLEALDGTDGLGAAGNLFTLGIRALADLAEAGDTDDATSAFGELARLRSRARSDPFAGPVPKMATAAGELWTAERSRLMRRSEPDAWSHAAVAWHLLRRPHRRAYALYRQAEAMLADHTMHAAAEPVLRSAAVAGSGHEPVMREIRQLARRARISLTNTEAPKPHESPIGLAKFGLTERELAVLRLLGQGHTNAEIGRMLFISPKTASVHVTNILRKLGAGSRVQAATIAERAGVLDQD